MKLTRERALELHRKMWSDMQKTLGDNPKSVDRIYFKEDWVHKHFPYKKVCNSCFLCEYVNESLGCRSCLIKWPNGYCGNYYLNAPISEILALPEREIEE